MHLLKSRICCDNYEQWGRKKCTILYRLWNGCCTRATLARGSLSANVTLAHAFAASRWTRENSQLNFAGTNLARVTSRSASAFAAWTGTRGFHTRGDVTTGRIRADLAQRVELAEFGHAVEDAEGTSTSAGNGARGGGAPGTCVHRPERSLAGVLGIPCVVWNTPSMGHQLNINLISTRFTED
ncbi:hypothetical protein C8R43DRAFT_955355 [Mycena crocata]|nr:hypothetical protein C8R43DRAFT_955355 [Mycena crocata]